MTKRKNNKTSNNEVIEQIKEIINSIRPYINMDGGDIEFIRYEDNYVFVKLTGACVECGLIDSTINDSLASTLQNEIPEIKGVINIDI